MTRRVFVLVPHVAVKGRRLEDKPSFEESERIGITRVAECRHSGVGGGEFNFDDVYPQNERNDGPRE